MHCASTSACDIGHSSLLGAHELLQTLDQQLGCMLSSQVLQGVSEDKMQALRKTTSAGYVGHSFLLHYAQAAVYCRQSTLPKLDAFMLFGALLAAKPLR